MPAKPSRSRLLVMAAVATLLLLAGVEGAARIVTLIAGYTPARPSPFDPVFAGSAELGWVLRPGFSGPAEDAPSRAFDNDGYATVDTAQVADTSVPRVVFIGDSNTFGYGVATEHSFVEVADDLLPGVHAINLGVPGYSSAQGVLVARKYLPVLRPQVAVISFNFNDRRYSLDQPDSPTQLQSVYRASREYWLNRVAGVAERSHAYILFRAVMRRVGLAPPIATESRHPTVNLDIVVPRVSVDDYRRNLETIIAICLENGVRPVLMLLHDDRAQSSDLLRAVDALAAGETVTALTLLEQVVAIPEDGLNVKAIARVRLADVYRAAGRIEEADRLVHVSPEFLEIDGQQPIRLDVDYNRAMQDVAAARGVELVDAASVLDALPGVFIDICHFNDLGHRRVGELLARVLQPLLAPARPAA